MDNGSLYESLESTLEREFPGLKLHMYWSDIVKVLKVMLIQVSDKRQGTGSEVMRRICSVADEHGHHVALSPDTGFGSSKAGLIRFYRRHGFVPSRDLAISETMIRFPRKG